MGINYNYLGEQFNNKYPYKYRIDLTGWQLSKVEQVIDWVEETSLPCIFAGNGLYVKDEQTVNFFILKWM